MSYKVGDRVVAVKDCNDNHFKNGWVGVIVNIYWYMKRPYRVKFENGALASVYGDSVQPYIEPFVETQFTTSSNASISVDKKSIGCYIVTSTPYPFKEKYMKAYMENAASWAKTSEATRLKVGCVIVDKESGGIIAQGCNGTPSGWHTNVCENEDSGETEWFVQHAEVNALNKLRKSTMSSVGSVVFVTHSPCKYCALQLIDAKVSHVYYMQEYRDLTGVDLLKKYGIVAEQFGI